MFDKVQKAPTSSSDWSPAQLQKQDNFSPQPQQEKPSSFSMPTKGEDTWSLDDDPLLSQWKKEEAAGETQAIAMANVAAQKEDIKSSSETKAGLEQSLAGQQTDEVETNHEVQKSQQKSVKSKKKSSLSSQEQFELANVIQKLLGFWEPVGMFVAGIIYQWLYHNGQPARWLLQVFVPGWDGLEKDVAQGLPKHWAFQAGQSLGDGLALATGIIEIITGGGAAAGGASLCTTVLGCLAGAPAMVGGLALGLHGSATSSSALTSIAARLGIVFHSSTGEGNSEDQRRSDHAQQRAQEGRPTGQALNDLQKARQGDVFVDIERDTIVVRAQGSREQIFNRQGKLVTSITQRTNKAHLNLLRNGSRRAISETEYQQFLEAAQKLWNF